LCLANSGAEYLGRRGIQGDGKQIVYPALVASLEGPPQRVSDSLLGLVPAGVEKGGTHALSRSAIDTRGQELGDQHQLGLGWLAAGPNDKPNRVPEPTQCFDLILDKILDSAY
jgi:hypothetical protein